MPAVPTPTPPTQTTSAGVVGADQGQRAAAAKMKGQQQAVFAGDTGGWKPSTPSLFGGAKNPNQTQPNKKLGGTSLLTT